MWRNDMKCEYMFLFPLISSACQGLIWWMTGLHLHLHHHHHCLHYPSPTDIIFINIILIITIISTVFNNTPTEPYNVFIIYIHCDDKRGISQKNDPNTSYEDNMVSQLCYINDGNFFIRKPPASYWRSLQAAFYSLTGVWWSMTDDN